MLLRLLTTDLICNGAAAELADFLTRDLDIPERFVLVASTLKADLSTP